MLSVEKEPPQHLFNVIVVNYPMNTMNIKLFLFFALLSTSVSAGFITPIETGIRVSSDISEKKPAYTDIHHYDIWQWLHATTNDKIMSESQAKIYYINKFFINDIFDIIKLTFEAGVYTASLIPNEDDEDKDMLQWLKPSPEIINYWQ